MKDLTWDWFISLEKLHQSDKTFGRTYQIYRYATKLMFVYERDGRARVYLRQRKEGNEWQNTILIGLVHTKKEVREMYKALTFEDLK